MSVQATTSPTARSVDLRPSEARATDVRVLIVDNERLLAEALEVVLIAEGIGIAVTSPDPDLLDDVRRRRPDVVILVVDAPSDADVRRGETIVDACGTTRVLLVASNVDRATMVRVSRAGLHCIPKHASVAELVRTVRSLADGGVPARDGYVPTAIDDAERDARRPASPALTPRELEVLELVATGATGRSIARQLGITENTVRTHSQSILGKLRVHSRLEAAAYAIRTGLVRLPSHGTVGSPTSAPTVSTLRRPSGGRRTTRTLP
jgi:DNA-binding NarL/FixJ family response regulator